MERLKTLEQVRSYLEKRMADTSDFDNIKGPAAVNLFCQELGLRLSDEHNLPAVKALTPTPTPNE
jgi:hypothetical protein